jgi:hypothetical protein
MSVQMDMAALAPEYMEGAGGGFSGTANAEC